MSYEGDGQAKIKIPLPFLRQGRQVPVRVGNGVKTLTDGLGIEQCGGCKERQKRWNQLLAFYGTRRR